MPLPSVIEIVPLSAPVHATITVPGSKSITNRALILAALAEGEVRLEGALWSEDTQVMVECLQELGFMVNVELDPKETCNRAITVYGRGGTVPRGGTEQQPVDLFVGNAGTAARFLTALLCLGSGAYRLHGVARMHERPQAALFEALGQLGYRIDSPNNKLPVLLHGGGPRPGKCQVSIEESSQFASALLLCASVGGWEVEVSGENADESPYVLMTSELIKAFPTDGGAFQVEPDASSASYFWAASHSRIKVRPGSDSMPNPGNSSFGFLSTPTISVSHPPVSGWQIDENFPTEFYNIGFPSPHFYYVPENVPEQVHRWFVSVQAAYHARASNPGDAVTLSRGPSLAKNSAVTVNLPEQLDRSHRLGDSIMTAIVLAPLALQRTRFVQLARLRLQECDRVFALRTELEKCGAKVIEEDDILTVQPSQVHGAEIETYNDHRMAMCFAILGLKVPGIRIKNPACVKKTFPNFFQKLAAPPPYGLGVTILHGETKQPLANEDLFAE